MQIKLKSLYLYKQNRTKPLLQNENVLKISSFKKNLLISKHSNIVFHIILFLKIILQNITISFYYFFPSNICVRQKKKVSKDFKNNKGWSNKKKVRFIIIAKNKLRYKKYIMFDSSSAFKILNAWCKSSYELSIRRILLIQRILHQYVNLRRGHTNLHLDR